MSAIFISHSSRDNALAEEVAERLKAQGHTSVFLDFHPEDGIPAGRDWEKELYHRLRVCRAVIVLCSEHSMASQWCFAEVAHARALGKPVIPVRIGTCEINEVLRDRQILDLARDAEEAYDRLWRALQEGGLDPKQTFEWDTKRPPYPGLLTFQEADSAVYFGRDDAIREGLDTLNRLHRLGGAQLALVLGASGSGKSSLVRAGLVPRLRRDPERWLVLDPFRPMGNPMAELADVLGREPPVVKDPAERLAAIGELARGLRREHGTREARVLLVVDQAEELLAPEHGDFVALLRTTCECEAFLVLATLRSDFLGDFQGHEALRGLPFETLPLGPMSQADLMHVICGPAELAGLTLETGLAQTLVEDAGDSDALPLLAFALRELWERRGRDGSLTVKVYNDDLGGLAGAVAKTAEETLPALTAEQEDALRRAFLQMARINEEGQFARAVLRWSDVDDTARPLLQRFVEARLLVSRGDGDETVVEVAHEALFRSWDRLARWLHESRKELRARANAEAAATRWREAGKEPGRLLPEGVQLEEARAILPTLRGNVREFVEVSIAAGHQAAVLRRKRARRFLAAIAGLVLVGALAAYAYWQKHQSDMARAEADNARGTAVKERDKAEAARAEADDARRDAETARARTETLKLVFEARSKALASSAGQPEAVAMSLDAIVRDLDAGRKPLPVSISTLVIANSHMERGLPLGQGGRAYHAAFSPDGTHVVTSDGDRTARIWNASDGTLVRELKGHSGRVTHAEFSPDGFRVVTSSHDRTARIWDAGKGTRRSRRTEGTS